MNLARAEAHDGRRRAIRAASRYVWAGPATLLGLTVGLFALWRGGIRVVDGVVEAHGPALRWGLRRLVPLAGGAAAMTIGHVVVATDAAALEQTRVHERAHVRQYERWGVFMLPAYFAACTVAWLRGGHPYADNWFEREARQVEAAARGFGDHPARRRSGSR